MSSCCTVTTGASNLSIKTYRIVAGTRLVMCRLRKDYLLTVSLSSLTRPTHRCGPVPDVLWESQAPQHLHRHVHMILQLHRYLAPLKCTLFLRSQVRWMQHADWSLTNLHHQVSTALIGWSWCPRKGRRSCRRRRRRR